MFGVFSRILKVACVAGLMTVASGVPVSALNVQPVVVDLMSKGRRSASIITLQNALTGTVPVELSVREVQLVDDQFQELEAESEDLMVFPATALVPEGQSHAFRVQWVGEPDLDRSKHYYVSVAQLPIDLPENENAVQILYNFKVLVSVGNPDGTAQIGIQSATIETDDSGRAFPVIVARNEGDTHGYVASSRMTIVQHDAAGTEIFRKSFTSDDVQRVMGLGLIPSGATRRLPLNVDLPRNEGTVSVTLSAAQGR